MIDHGGNATSREEPSRTIKEGVYTVYTVYRSLNKKRFPRSGADHQQQQPPAVGSLNSPPFRMMPQRHDTIFFKVHSFVSVGFCLFLGAVSSPEDRRAYLEFVSCGREHRMRSASDRSMQHIYTFAFTFRGTQHNFIPWNNINNIPPNSIASCIYSRCMYLYTYQASFNSFGTAPPFGEKK